MRRAVLGIKNEVPFGPAYGEHELVVLNQQHHLDAAAGGNAADDGDPQPAHVQLQWKVPSARVHQCVASVPVYPPTERSLCWRDPLHLQ
eukprot:scaffold16110_cov148-Isochrysis_galbana.AAC.5